MDIFFLYCYHFIPNNRPGFATSYSETDVKCSGVGFYFDSSDGYFNNFICKNIKTRIDYVPAVGSSGGCIYAFEAVDFAEDLDEDSVSYKNKIIINNGIFDNSWTSGYGGSIYINKIESFSITNSIISNSYSMFGGGIYIRHLGSIIIDNVQFINNYCSFYGCGLLVLSNECKNSINIYDELDYKNFTNLH